jgi:hypothetical protein
MRKAETEATVNTVENIADQVARLAASVERYRREASDMRFRFETMSGIAKDRREMIADLSRRLAARDRELEGSRRKSKARGAMVDRMGLLISEKNRCIETLRFERFSARLAANLALARTRKRDDLAADLRAACAELAAAAAGTARQRGIVAELTRQRDLLYQAWKKARSQSS